MPKEKLLQQINQALDTTPTDSLAFGINYKELPDDHQVNPFRLSISRRSLGTLSVGLMLQSKDPTYSLENMMDSNTYASVKADFGKKAIDLYKAVDSKSMADAYLTALRASAQYIKEHFKPGMTPGDYLRPENIKLLQAMQIFTDATQEINYHNDAHQYLYSFASGDQEAISKEVHEDANLSAILYFTSPYYSSVFSYIKDYYEKGPQAARFADKLQNSAVPVFQDMLLEDDEYKKLDKEKDIVPYMGNVAAMAPFVVNSLGGEFTNQTQTKEGMEVCIQAFLTGKLQNNLFEYNGDTIKAASQEKIGSIFKDKELLESAFPEQVDATQQFLKNATSNELYGIWDSEEEMDRIIKLDNPLSIARERNGLQTMVVGRLLIEHPDYTIDDVLDPAKHPEEIKRIASEVKAKYEELAGSNTEELRNAFGVYAAEAYVKVVEASKVYTQAHRRDIKSVTDAVQPDNRSFIAMTVVLQDAIQHAANKHFKQYTLAVPGMTEDRLTDLQVNFQLSTNTYGNTFKNYNNSLKAITDGEPVSSHTISDLIYSVIENEIIKNGAGRKKSIYEDSSYAQKVVDVKRIYGNELIKSSGEKLISTMVALANTPEGRVFLSDLVTSGEFAKDLCTIKKGEVTANFDKLERIVAEFRMGQILKSEAVNNGSDLQTLVSEGRLMTGTGVVVNDAEKAAQQCADTVIKGHGLYLYKKDEQGNLQPHEVLYRGNGLSISRKPVELYAQENKEQLLNKLESIHGVLAGTGRSKRDSDEYSDMIDEFDDALDVIKNSKTKTVIDKTITDLQDKATKYYYGVLLKSHNSKRSIRFSETLKIINFNKPEISERDMLLKALAEKAAWTQMRTFESEEKVSEEIKNIDPDAYEKLMAQRTEKVLASDKFQQMFGNMSIGELKKIISKSENAVEEAFFSKDDEFSSIDQYLDEIRAAKKEDINVKEAAEEPKKNEEAVKTETAEIKPQEDIISEKNFEQILAEKYIKTMIDSVEKSRKELNPEFDPAKHSPSYFEEMAKLDPEMAANAMAEKLKDHPVIKDLAAKTQPEDYSKAADDFCKNVRVGAGILSEDPEVTRSMLDCLQAQLNNKFTDTINNSPDLTNEDKKLLQDSVSEFEKSKNILYRKDLFTTKDLKTISDNFAKIQKTTQTILDAKGADPNADTKALNELKSFSKLRSKEINEEINYHKITDSIAESIDKHYGHTQKKVMDAIEENIHYQQEKLRLLVIKNSKMVEESKRIRYGEALDRWNAYASNHIATYDKSWHDICANILVNTSLRERINTEGDKLCIREYRKMADPKSINRNIKEMKNCQAFKTLVEKRDFHLSQIMAKPNENYPKESVDNLHKQLRDIARTQQNERDRNTSKELDIRQK